MEKRYISEGRYKKSSARKRRDIKKIRKKVVTDVENKKKLENKKLATGKKNVKKNKKKISPKVRKEMRIRRRNTFACIILIILIVIIFRAILKDEGEPFIPNFWAEEENESVLTLGIITTDDLRDENTNNVVLKELKHYTSYMLLKVNEDYTLKYDVLENIEKINEKEYVLTVKKSKEYTAESIKNVILSYMVDEKSVYYPNVSNIEQIVSGENTLKIILKEQDPYFIYNLELPVGNTLNKEYVVSKEASATIKIYERTKAADKTLPKRIIVKRYKDMYAGVEAYKKAEINILITNQKNVQNMLGKYEYNVSTVKTGESIFLLFNQNSELISRDEIRKVLAYGINRDSIIKETMQSLAETIDLPYVYDKPKYKYDIYAAENLLLSNGYTKANKVYTKDKKKVELTLIVNKEDEEKVAIANTIKNNLTALGVNINVEKLTKDELNKRIAKGTYDLVLASVNLNNNPNINFITSKLYLTEGTKTALEVINTSDAINLPQEIKNVSNAMSESISAIGIVAKTTYVISNKNLTGLTDISYLNILKNLI